MPCVLLGFLRNSYSTLRIIDFGKLKERKGFVCGGVRVRKKRRGALPENTNKTRVERGRVGRKGGKGHE